MQSQREADLVRYAGVLALRWIAELGSREEKISRLARRCVATGYNYAEIGWQKRVELMRQNGAPLPAEAAAEEAIFWQFWCAARRLIEEERRTGVLPFAWDA